MRVRRNPFWLQLAAALAIGVIMGARYGPLYLDRPDIERDRLAPMLERAEAMKILERIGWRQVDIKILAHTFASKGGPVKDITPVTLINGRGIRDAWETNLNEVLTWDPVYGWFHLSLALEGERPRVKVCTATGTQFLDKVGEVPDAR